MNSGLAPTNVATLARCLKPVADDGYLQISYYDSGVGNGTSKVAQLIDGATGRGTFIRFTVFNYSPSASCIHD